MVRILPWLNGDLRGVTEIRRALWGFVEARGLTGVLASPQGFFEARDLVMGATAAELDAVRQQVELVIAQGIGRPLHLHSDQTGKEHLWDHFEDFVVLGLPSLRFGLSKGTIRVAGRPSGMLLRDLVPFMVLLLLASPDLQGKRALQWCQAPLRDDWSKQCGRLFIWSGQGRPQLACSPACITRRRDQARFKNTGKQQRRRKR